MSITEDNNYKQTIPTNTLNPINYDRTTVTAGDFPNKDEDSPVHQSNIMASDKIRKAV